MRTKSLVTGCAGFIGSHLVGKLLMRGDEVVGIDCFTDYYPREIKERNLTDAMKHRNFRLIEQDILEISEFPEVDYVFHQAAQAGVRKSWGTDFGIYTRNNIEATQKLLEFYKDLNIKKFVYASSSSVYGNADPPFTENSLLKPYSPYGVTKLAAENLCHLYHKNYGVPTVSLRYFTVYGPRQRPDMAIYKFVQAALKGDEIIVFGDGMQTRDFTYIDDAVEANFLAARSRAMGEVFNIGGGSRISINDLVKMIEDIVGRRLKIKYEEKQKGDVRSTWADISKAKEGMGWEPKVAIREGLRRFMDWFKMMPQAKR